MFKFRLIFSILFLALTVSSSHAADEVFARVMKNKEINCGYFIWTPDIIQDANSGKLSGTDYEIMDAIGKVLKLKINWTTEIAPGDIPTALATNKFDVMCTSMWMSPDRFSDTIYTTVPQIYSLIFPVVRTDDKRFDQGIALANKKEIKVTGVEGDITADIAREQLPQATTAFVGPMASPSELLMQVTTKKADVLFVDAAMISEFSKTNPGLLKVLDKSGPVRIFGEYNMLKPGEMRLRDMLDMALQQLANDGTLDKVAKKYADKYDTILYPPAKTVAQP